MERTWSISAALLQKYFYGASQDIPRASGPDCGMPPSLVSIHWWGGPKPLIASISGYDTAELGQQSSVCPELCDVMFNPTVCTPVTSFLHQNITNCLPVTTCNLKSKHVMNIILYPANRSCLILHTGPLSFNKTKQANTADSSVGFGLTSVTS